MLSEVGKPEALKLLVSFLSHSLKHVVQQDNLVIIFCKPIH